MRQRIINAFAWLLTQFEEIIATAWNWIEAMERDKRMQADARRAVAELEDEPPGEYVFTVNEQTIYTIEKREPADNAVHLPRSTLN